MKIKVQKNIYEDVDFLKESNTLFGYFKCSITPSKLITLVSILQFHINPIYSNFVNLLAFKNLLPKSTEFPLNSYPLHFILIFYIPKNDLLHNQSQSNQIFFI